jgi:transposase
MRRTINRFEAVATIGIDIGKNTFRLVDLDRNGGIVLRQKLSRRQVEARLANMPPCLIGMEPCVGAHHLSRQLKAYGHDARLMPARYVRPYSKGQKNDFRDAEAIAEAVLGPTMKFVAIKTVDQLDLQALHRVRERLVCQRTSVINQIRAFLLGARHSGAPGTASPAQRDAHYPRHDGQAVAPHDPHDRNSLRGLAPSRWAHRDRVG